MKSVLISSFVATLMLFIQSTWLSRGIIMGIIPNLALDVLLFSSFINKEGQGIIASFLVGIIADILSASPLGYYAFLYTSCGYYATLISYVTEKDIFIVPFLLGAGATIIMAILSKAISLMFSAGIHYYQVFSMEFGVELILNGLFAILLFFLLSFIRQLFEHNPKKAMP
ncbi:MAG: rod shape-determining protein MreD [Spirochaetes bacterium ADurb.Bin110]|nr:MAG: rod shape-determining protein MreD [Spirochaetes bacterium ADurb.Bin110]